MTMDKGAGSDLFVNDGSFMEKFKQLQKEKSAVAVAADPSANSSVALKSSIMLSKRPVDIEVNDMKKATTQVSGGKLAFSLKQKSKVALMPVKFVADEEDEEAAASEDKPVKRQKLGQGDIVHSSAHISHPEDVAYVFKCLSTLVEGMLIERIRNVALLLQHDPAVQKVADKLASFVAKNGRQFEHVTRQRNPGDTPFKFLFDSSCSDYKYYEYRLSEEEKILSQLKESKESNCANGSTSSSRAASSSQRSAVQQHSDYQTPTPALYGSYEESGSSGRSSTYAESSGPSASDPIAMMEFYMKKAAREERKRQPKQSKDEMPPPASLQASSKKGHHMGDFIPPEELEKFLFACNDAAAQKATKEVSEKAKIQADNIGHKLLSKMGWKEGEGLGSDKRGRADPVMAGEVKKDHLGVGAHKPGEVNTDDDIYEQYKKRMMLGYRYRPNPLNNPRKAYY